MNQEVSQTPTEAPRRQIAREEISRRAEQLWRERNCPNGCDDQIWLEAESELQGRAEARPVSGTESRPNIDEPGSPLRRNTRSSDPSESAAQLRSATETQPRSKAEYIR
ncbi:MAG: hypothetical protein RIQ93_1291 [Verrucomicrobiota bacterium]|jgi:hypothetical protein